MNIKKVLILTFFITTFFVPLRIATATFAEQSSNVIELLKSKNVVENAQKIHRLNKTIKNDLTNQIKETKEIGKKIILEKEFEERKKNLTKRLEMQSEKITNFLQEVDEEIQKRELEVSELPQTEGIAVTPFEFIGGAQDEHELKEIKKQKQQILEEKTNIEINLEKLKRNNLSKEEKEKKHSETLENLEKEETDLRSIISPLDEKFQKLKKDEIEVERLEGPAPYTPEGPEYREKIENIENEKKEIRNKIKPLIEQLNKNSKQIEFENLANEDLTLQDIENLENRNLELEIKLTSFFAAKSDTALKTVSEILVTYILTGRPIPAKMLYKIGSYVDINAYIYQYALTAKLSIINLIFKVLSAPLKIMFSSKLGQKTYLPQTINNLKNYVNQSDIAPFLVITSAITSSWLKLWLFDQIRLRLLQIVGSYFLQPLIDNGILAPFNVGILNIESLAKIISIIFRYYMTFEQIKSQYQLVQVTQFMNLPELTKRLYRDITAVLQEYNKTQITYDDIVEQKGQKFINAKIPMIIQSVRLVFNTSNIRFLISILNKLNGIYSKITDLIPITLAETIDNAAQQEIQIKPTPKNLGFLADILEEYPAKSETETLKEINEMKNSEMERIKTLPIKEQQKEIVELEKTIAGIKEQSNIEQELFSKKLEQVTSEIKVPSYEIKQHIIQKTGTTTATPSKKTIEDIGSTSERKFGSATIPTIYEKRIKKTKDTEERKTKKMLREEKKEGQKRLQEKQEEEKYKEEHPYKHWLWEKGQKAKQAVKTTSETLGITTEEKPFSESQEERIKFWEEEFALKNN